jgi:bifunctional DNA-binding transcriptional regulator/antitoxin component of YhaV-PrlF toxin-antitoxin module
MNIAKCKLDKRGRITLPLSFLKANDINPGDCEAIIQIVTNIPNAIKILFVKKGE